MFAGRSVLITGGTGSFGRKFAERLLKSEPAIGRIIIFSRDELKQYEMANTPYILVMSVIFHD
jgi:FlaA1/EpsC-like NDP-sugar epimerase